MDHLISVKFKAEKPWARFLLRSLVFKDRDIVVELD